MSSHWSSTVASILICTGMLSTDRYRSASSQDVVVHRWRLELDPQQEAVAERYEDGVCAGAPNLADVTTSETEPGGLCLRCTSLQNSVGHTSCARVYVDGAITMRTNINHVLSGFIVLRHIKSVCRYTHVLNGLNEKKLTIAKSVKFGDPCLDSGK